MTTPGEPQESSGAAPQAREDGRPIAAFDFDGTLTTRDSFTAFLRWRMGGWRWGAGLLRLLPNALAYLVTRDRGRLKAASVRVFLRGLSREALQRETGEFAVQLGPRLLRPDALQAWEAHRGAGDRLVIVTASPEEVVAPFAMSLGADALIGTRLRWTVDGRIGDGLAGANCRGMEKVRRLRDRFGEGAVVGDAYGDTSGDREMLAMALRGHMQRFVGRP